MPAADVLRLAQPRASLVASDKVRASFDSESAAEGMEFGRLFPGMDVRPRALVSWPWEHGVSELAGSASGEVAQTLRGVSASAFRSGARRIRSGASGISLELCIRSGARRIRIRRFGFGVKMRSTLVGVSNTSGFVAEKFLHSPHVGARPFELSRQCWDSCKVENCTK